MKNTTNYNRWIFLALTALFFQFSIAQEFDFEQTNDDDKLVVIEAENFSSNTPKGDVTWSLTDSPADFSGTGALMAVTGSAFATKESALEGSAVLTYKIKFIRNGHHYIWARASRTGGGDDSYHAGIDGVITDSSTFLTFHKTTFTNGTWGWINFHNTVGPASVNIPSMGVHELNIYIRENGFRIDKIILTKSDTSQFKPEGMGPDETKAASGMNDTDVDNELLFYPNPAKDFVQLKTRVSDGVIKIVDLQGKLLKTFVLDNNIEKFDISDIESGMYFIQLEKNNEITGIEKLIKN